MRKITIHEALATLKVIDQRIEKANSLQYVVENRHNNEKIGGESIQVVAERFKSNLQSVKDLMANRTELKRKIAMSNAVTKIVVSGKEYTVVEAIEEKNFVQVKKNFLSRLKFQLRQAQDRATSFNNLLPDKADAYIADLFNVKDKTASFTDEVKKAREQYIAANSFELVDPNKLSDFISQQEKELDDFENNIDFKLSESNALTFIEVELLGE